MNTYRLKLAGGAAALVAAVGGGAALAADRLSPTDERDAIVADAAKELGVAPARLEAALKKALENRVDAAVADGRLTAAQAAELKRRIAAGDVPLMGPGHHGHHGALDGGLHHADDLGVAATYLGVSEESLRTSLRNGSTLADLATANGKTVAGLKAALLTAATARLDEAVAAGRLTAARRTQILAGLPARIDALVAGELRSGARSHGGRDGMHPHMGPPGP